MARDRYGIKISPNAFKRIADASRFVEQQPRNRVAPPTIPVNYGGAVMFHVTTALPRMSGATPGAGGAGRIQKLVSGSYEDFNTTAYPILNPTTSLVAVGAYVLCVPSNGIWTMITVNQCSNLS